MQGETMATAADPTITMTTRLTRGMKDELDALAKSTGRNRNALVQEALRRFIDVQRWQIAEIEAGIREADAGIFVGDEEMDALWAEFGLEPDTARERGG
jgi:RHH-type transcriptional regulator, rel operon repressor / antitoxin RelB